MDFPKYREILKKSGRVFKELQNEIAPASKIRFNLLLLILFTTPSARAGYDTRSIF